MHVNFHSKTKEITELLKRITDIKMVLLMQFIQVKLIVGMKV
jgi:hypothetical protein